jgi:hypothetical protein
MAFDEVVFGFDEIFFDQVVDSIKMAFDKVVGRHFFMSPKIVNLNKINDFCRKMYR